MYGYVAAQKEGPELRLQQCHQVEIKCLQNVESKHNDVRFYINNQNKDSFGAKI